MRLRRKAPEADLRRRYTLFMEIGLVVALLLLVVAFRLDLRPRSEFVIVEKPQETVKMEEIEQTKQVDRPPPPPPPPVPVEVPDDKLLEEEDVRFESELNQQAANLPPPPPPPPAAPQQKEPEPEPEVFVIVEEMPELIGGLEGLQRRIRYPEIARKAGVEGTVMVQFVVDENGNVTNAQVIKGIGAGCDEEALRAVQESKFKPGKQRGRPVRVQMTLPVRFRLKS
ncbi:MAG: energy transducer TonB [Bacteroidetes bacterium]|nr:energy transducer TonB [Rhodothermia bacterium]MCS7155333.1 energy transducer TonB [Bacteroidota bacterium]MCX7907574.1 energy transducer TonB [Bacteroidota bacterium]MDW8138568.1 energy transducer TonB [Bacteroidota bacterium]MDW8284495.1 energy transducer TonB [Bacteroidota bacterium]